MKTFVINLDKDRKRWAEVERQLYAVNLDFDRVSAVYGRDLSTEQIAAHYDPVQSSWRVARQLTPSEIGCALSHIRTYREIVTRDLSHALILEDDVILQDEIVSLLDQLAAHMPHDVPTVCLLSEVEAFDDREPVSLSDGYALKGLKTGYFTSSYCVNQAAARYLLSQLHPVGDVADCWHRLIRSGELKIWAADPAVTVQNREEFGSSTSQDIRAAFSASCASKALYKLRRARNIVFGRFVGSRWSGDQALLDPQQPHPIDGLKIG